MGLPDASRVASRSLPMGVQLPSPYHKFFNFKIRIPDDSNVGSQTAIWVGVLRCIFILRLFGNFGFLFGFWGPSKVMSPRPVVCPLFAWYPKTGILTQVS